MTCIISIGNQVELWDSGYMKIWSFQNLENPSLDREISKTEDDHN